MKDSTFTIVKLLVIILVITMLGSCHSSDNDPVFLVMSGEDSVTVSHDGFEDAKNAGFGVSRQEKYFEELEGKKINFLDNKDLIYQKSIVAYRSLNSNEIGSFYSVFDEYKSQDGLVEVRCIQGTNKPVYYSVNTSIKNDSSEKQIDEKQAQKIAEEFILECFDEDMLDKYTLVDVSLSPTGLSYVVYYVRYIDGYSTEEDIEVYLDMSGDIWGANFDNVEKFDNVSTKITKKKLDSAYEQLKEKIDSLELKDVKINDPSIVTDVMGNVYLEISVSYTKIDMTSTCDMFYISIV